MTSRPQRIAFLGITLESNAFAPVTTAQDFRDRTFLEGAALEAFVHEAQTIGFGRRMSELCAWELAPILLYEALPGGPCDHAFFEECLTRIRDRLRAAMPIDGVFIFGHGAGTTTALDDLDGAYFQAVRDIVGDVPIVAELDLHANVSDLMRASADVLVGYRTNPHIDISARSEECADILVAMLKGQRPKTAAARLPLVTPQVTQLTTGGEPLGDAMRMAESFLSADICNVTVLPGFAFGDTAYNGMTILAASWSSQEAAEEVVLRLARMVWNDRARYHRALTPLEGAVQRAAVAAQEADVSPIILADIADNPGGGGRGNTTWLLDALHQAGVVACALGLFYDPALAEEAHWRGEGAHFMARFNRAESNTFSKPVAMMATVRKLTDGAFTAHTGAYAGNPTRLGLSCLLDINGLLVCVASKRVQILSPEYFTHFGVELSAVRTFIVKSRGHFRAGFAPLVDGSRIFEIDLPGLTTANLATLPWRHLPRPVYPIDALQAWEPTLLPLPNR